LSADFHHLAAARRSDLTRRGLASRKPDGLIASVAVRAPTGVRSHRPALSRSAAAGSGPISRLPRGLLRRPPRAPRRGRRASSRNDEHRSPHAPPSDCIDAVSPGSARPAPHSSTAAASSGRRLASRNRKWTRCCSVLAQACYRHVNAAHPLISRQRDG